MLQEITNTLSEIETCFTSTTADIGVKYKVVECRDKRSNMIKRLLVTSSAMVWP